MYNYWRELYCKFLQGYLKPRLNKLPKEKKIIFLIWRKNMFRLTRHLDFWTPVVAGRVLWNRVRPSFRLSGRFLGVVSLVFSNFWHVARNPYCVVRIFQRNFIFPNVGKMGQDRICSIMKILYLLCSCTNPIFGKIPVPEIWAKMFSANYIAGFLNQRYLQNKSMK